MLRAEKQRQIVKMGQPIRGVHVFLAIFVKASVKQDLPQSPPCFAPARWRGCGDDAVSCPKLKLKPSMVMTNDGLGVRS